ncbi:ABC transporter substrate-binding protein [Mesorhizobium marinum]|uniref:Glycine betaine ABC transporter substrate-binding protein n=1 Tax=Mesorhizobium marinum TaxID=3228790 RepID=A0ABV3R177_9HYPH
MFRPMLFAAASLLALAGPAPAADLVIAMPNWPSGQASANILKFAIAKEFGLDAEVREVGTMLAFAGMDSGEIAAVPEVWQPNFDDLVKRYGPDGSKSVVLSHLGVAAWQGLCATSDAAAAGIKDVADLSDPAKTALLDTDGDGTGEIWIGASTWTSTGIERVRANSYGYASSVTLVEAEEDVAMAAVDAAVATGRPMVFYCYAPHHIFNLHDIVRLTEPPYDPAKWKIVPQSEDPLWISKSSAPVAWGPVEFHIAYSAAFAAKHPDVAAFLEKVDFKPDEISAMSYALQVDRQVPADFAKAWIETNGGRVDGWRH